MIKSFHKFVISTIFILATYKVVADCGENKIDPTIGACFISINQLLIDNLDFSDRVVKLKGVINFEFEGQRLYMNQFAFENKIYPDSIRLNFGAYDTSSLGQYNGKVATIFGFTEHVRGKFESVSGIFKVRIEDEVLLVFYNENGAPKLHILSL